MVRRSRIKNKGPADEGFILDDYILYNLVRSAAVYNDEMAAALKSHGLTTMEWRILMLLDDKSPSTVSELARRSVSKMPTITRMLMRMEEDGLVVRTELANDRRIIQITMTPKAKSTLRKVQAIGQRVFKRALEDVTAADAAIVTQTLKTIRGNLQRSPYDAGKPD